MPFWFRSPDKKTTCPRPLYLSPIQTHVSVTEESPKPISESAPNPPSWRGLLQDLAWAMSIFLVGTGLKLRLIFHCASSLPYTDQWDGEGANLYIPFYQHRSILGELLSGNNEHRILFTRLYDLLLLVFNHQWDNRLQMVCNAMIHAATLAGLGWLLARLLGRKFWPVLWVLLVPMLALPFGWENTLAGFQSQFYFLVTLNFLAIWLWGLHDAFSWKWWLGVTAAVLSVFTVASGCLTGLTLCALGLLEVARERRVHWRHLVSLTLAGGIFVVAAALTPKAPGTHDLQVQSLRDWVTAFGNDLAWPWIILPPFAAANLLPVLWLGWIYFRSAQPMRGERMILGISIWVVLQALAISYARGAGGHPPYWRYMDFLCHLTVASALSAVLLLTRYRRQIVFPRVLTAGFAFWVVCVTAGLFLLTQRATGIDIPERQLDQRKQEATVREFLAGNDIGLLRRKPIKSLPNYHVDMVADVLRNPDIRRILPECVRIPLDLVPSPGSNQVFTSRASPPVTIDPLPGPCLGNWKAGATQFACGKFESLPVTNSAFPFLEIPVEGYLGQTGVSLKLVELDNGQVTDIKPPNPPGNPWTKVLVKSPGGPFKLVAENNDEAKWFAFKPPREVGLLSGWGMRLTNAWRWWVVSGLGCLALGWLARSRESTVSASLKNTD